MRYGENRPWTLLPELVDWLDGHNMAYEHRSNFFDEDGKTYIEQLLTFNKARDAMLFKLTWM